MSLRRLLAAGAVLAGALAGGTGCRREAAAGSPPAAGSYVVLEDSSTVRLLFVRDGRAVAGELGPVLGAVDFEEGFRGVMLGKGSLTLALNRPALPDSAQASALARDVFQVDASRENRTATLALRELSGKRFTSGLPAGGVTPVTGRGQLVVHGMAVSRDFEGEIARTPSGYRITNVAPIVVSIGQLGLEDEVAAWTAATGGGAVADPVAITVDLRLARRGTP